MASFYPLMTFAQTPDPCALGSNPNFGNLVTFLICNITKFVIPLIFTFAVVMFIWGVVRYVINSSDEAQREQGRQFMLWGIIALTVMISVWGLVNILGATFNINFAIPQV